VAAATTVTAATVLGEHVDGKEGHRKGKARGQRDESNWRAHRVTLHRQGRLGLCNESTTERLVGTASRCVGGPHTCPPARTKQGGGGVANWGRIRTNLKKSYDAAWAADGPA